MSADDTPEDLAGEYTAGEFAAARLVVKVGAGLDRLWKFAYTAVDRLELAGEAVQRRSERIERLARHIRDGEPDTTATEDDNRQGR